MKKPQQQVVTVFKHGPKPRRMCRVLVAGHSSLDHIKGEISEGLGIAIREHVVLNTVRGHEVQTVNDILAERSNIIVASFPGEFDREIYNQRKRQPTDADGQLIPTLTHIPFLLPSKSSLRNILSKTKPHVQFHITDHTVLSKRQLAKRYKPKGAYQRVAPPSHRLPAMSKSSTTRLPPIAGGWDNSSDGRSSGSDVMAQRRVGYERQMKREYNARHNSRMNKLNDESQMEVSDILLTHDRQRRADHQIRLERRQKLALKHLKDQEHRLHQAYKPNENKLRPEKRVTKKLNDKVRVAPGSEYHQDVVNLFTTNRNKLPNSINKHSVLPGVGNDRKTEKASLIPLYSPSRHQVEITPKKKREYHGKLSQIPVKAPIPTIPSIKKPKYKAHAEVIREVVGGSHTPRSHVSVTSTVPTPDQLHTPKPAEQVVRVIPARRPSTPIIKPTSSSKVSVTSGIESLFEEAEDVIHVVHTPQINDDLGYDSPKPTPKHPKLSSAEVDEDGKLPAKLTLRDSGLADSIEPDSTGSRRQSLSPQTSEMSTDEEPSVNKLDPVTEETETESPPLLPSIPSFKPMLATFHPKSETQLNQDYITGKTLGDGNFAIVKAALSRASKDGVAIKIIDKEKLKGKEGMMVNEIKIMRRLNHDHCVKLYDIYESEPHIYLVSELVRDGDLFDCIVKNRSFSEGVVRGMMLDMVSALHYMHSLNIVHRDIKPENILVNRVGDRYRLKLADFGLSMVIKEPIYTICGTPTYIAPEILVECGYGLEIDMWAIGVINYILLCGFPPFRSKNKDQEELFSLIMAGEFRFISPYWDKVTRGAKDLITRLLQVVPEDRSTARQVLSHPWLSPPNED